MFKGVRTSFKHQHGTDLFTVIPRETGPLYRTVRFNRQRKGGPYAVSLLIYCDIV